MDYSNSEFLIETIVPRDELIVSRTNLSGIITFANDTFAQISGYEVEELIGKKHNIVRHPDMPKRVFKQMWQDLEEKGQWAGVVKNLRKDGGFYWVYAEVSEVHKNGELVEYKSLRTPISFEDKLFYQKKYDEMKKQKGELVRVIKYKAFE